MKRKPLKPQNTMPIQRKSEASTLALKKNPSLQQGSSANPLPVLTAKKANSVPVKRQPKPYFFPKLRSKYLTIEVLKYLFQSRIALVGFLRALSKDSQYFLDKFYEAELKDMFEQCPITIQIPLIQELSVEESKTAQSEHSDQLERVKGYSRLQKIEEFQDSFVLGLKVYAIKFERPILLVEESVQKQCIELIKRNIYNF